MVGEPIFNTGAHTSAFANGLLKDFQGVYEVNNNDLSKDGY